MKPEKCIWKRFWFSAERTDAVRSIDVANRMGYSRPTISVMMKKFRRDGLITMNEAGHITLTDSGRKIAERVYERHEVIAKFLRSIGVGREQAYEMPVYGA
ncbi:MAG: metal-dependent transcriptional regulator [Saccharofermentanales bacterium]